MGIIEGERTLYKYPNTDRDRLYHPNDCVMMEVQKHAVLKLTGPSALLMQVYRREVGAGVHNHSDFQNNVLSRYKKTSQALQTLYFGTVGDVLDTAKQINRTHSKVSGTVVHEETNEEIHYDARTSELTQWVWATLAYSSLEGYNRMVAPLSSDDMDTYVQQSQQPMRYLGGNLEEFPQSYEGMYAYMNDVADAGLVHPVPFTAKLEDDIFNPFPRMRAVTERFRPAFDVMAGGFMHPAVRDKCMDWTDRHEQSFTALTHNMGRIRSALPAKLQHLPAYNNRQ